MTQALYSATELHHIINSDIILVAVLSQEDYDAGHIPNSRHILPSELTCNEKPAPGLLPPTASLQVSLERLGIENNKTIIAYDNAGGSVAGRFIWTLALFGFEQTALLNGGLKAWYAANLNLTTDVEEYTPSELSLTLNTQYIASKDDVLAALDDIANGHARIWDARGEDEYAGTKILAERGGHIPGATSFNWLRLQGENTILKPLNEIENALVGAGIDGSKPIITHCQTHRRSGLTWFVAHKLLGWPITAYAGSWSEWGNDASLPIES